MLDFNRNDGAAWIITELLHLAELVSIQDDKLYDNKVK